MTSDSTLAALELAQSFAIGRLAAAAHGVLAAHNESDEALLTSRRLDRLDDALHAYDVAQKALVDYLATPLKAVK